MPLENSACCYHPDLPKFKEIHGTNTECAEQTFNWLERHKSVTRMMTQYKFNFYIWNMINGHNSRIYDLAISNVRKQSHNTLNIMHAYILYCVRKNPKPHRTHMLGLYSMASRVSISHRSLGLVV